MIDYVQKLFPDKGQDNSATHLQSFISQYSENPVEKTGLKKLIFQKQFESCPPLGTADLLPDYRLRRNFHPDPTVAGFLTDLAGEAEAADRTDIAIALSHAAVALDDACVTALLHLGRHADETGDRANALAYAERAVTHAPDAVDALVLLGRMQLANDQAAAALATFDRVWQIVPDHLDTCWYRGHVLTHLHRLGEAALHFERVLVLAPAFGEAKVALAGITARLGNLPKAIEIARSAVAEAALPHRLTQLGSLLAEAGLLDEAQSRLTQALAADPDDRAAQAQLARLYSRLGHFPKARDLIAQGLARYPDDPDLLLARCQVTLDRGQEVLAAKFVEQIIARWPRNADAWYLRAALYHRKQDLKAADECFEHVRAINPRHLTATLEWCDVLLKLGRAADAGWLADMILSESPSRTDARHLLIRALFDQGQTDAALRQLTLLHRIPVMRQDASLWLGIATALFLRERKSGARLAIRRALGVAPHHPDVLRLAADLALQAGDLAEAVARITASLRVAPEATVSYGLATAIHLATGDLSAADLYAERAIASEPAAAENWFRLGCLRHRQGHLAAAEEALQQALQRAPGLAKIRQHLGLVLAADDRLAEALIAIEGACEIEPANAGHYRVKASLLEQAGRIELALAAASQAIELAPYDAETEGLMARLSFKAGLQDRAAHHAAMALRLDPAQPTAGIIAARLAAAGIKGGQELLAARSPTERGRFYRAALQQIDPAIEKSVFREVATAAYQALPEEGDIELAWLQAFADTDRADDLARKVRHWGRRQAMQIGQEPPRALSLPTPGGRLRVAYIAGQGPLDRLSRLILQHDLARVELHLYTDAGNDLPPDVRARVTLHRLTETNLPRSCAVNGIEVAVDLEGLTPFEGQMQILHALRRRLAPIQCGPVSALGTGGGLYDLLIDRENADIAALEQHWLSLRTEAKDLWSAPTAKDRSRALARRAFESWLQQGSRLSLPTTEAPDVSVVIVLFNQVGLSLETLIGLADQSDARFETIIIDNASSDQTGALLERIDGAKILVNPDNLGFLKAANQGAALARGKHILFLNSDAILHESAISNAVRRIDADPGIGILGGRITLADGSLQEAGCIAYRDGTTQGYGRGEDPGHGNYRFSRDVDYTSGAFLLIRRALWRALDGFDPAYAPAYYEDSDLCFRAWRGGFRTVYAPDVLVNHLEWGSADSPAQARAMMGRNAEIFRARHREALAERPPPLEADPEQDRWSASRRPRLLMIDDAVPSDSPSRAVQVVQTLTDYQVTFLPLGRVEEAWHEVHAILPSTTEVILGCPAGGLEAFLDSRAGCYAVLLVRHADQLSLIQQLRTRRPDLFVDLRLIYDGATDHAGPVPGVDTVLPASLDDLAFAVSGIA
jgi:GT2 family glycosyltransferase/tetratricopeptide (TPR) repeat protein